MTMRAPLGLGATLLAWATCAPAQAYEIAFREASIPMPDGVKLAADLYLPQGGKRTDRFPVLLEYLPYRKTESRDRDYRLYSYFVDRGYAVARVDIRATGNSEGRLIAYEYTDQEQSFLDRARRTTRAQRAEQGSRRRQGRGRHLRDPGGASWRMSSGGARRPREQCDGHHCDDHRAWPSFTKSDYQMTGRPPAKPKRGTLCFAPASALGRRAYPFSRSH
jgi:hypothetical protein